YSFFLKILNKFLLQSLIFIVEIILLVGGSTYIISIFLSSSLCISSEDLFYFFYKLFVYSILKVYDNSQKDSFNTVKTKHEEGILILSTFPEEHYDEAKMFCLKIYKEGVIGVMNLFYLIILFY
ncbi:MAG: hypothetical protein MJ203_02155, partial [archaeon]|nr:hypothetical protein [archaeon]